MLLGFATLCGCVSHPPTIAHVHIGHALTSVRFTPGELGYVPLAVLRANTAYEAARAATETSDLQQAKADVAAAVQATNDPDSFGVKQALILASNHISFAATSADASANVIAFAPEFKRDITGVVGRCDYVTLLGEDMAKATSLAQARLLAMEIASTTQANLSGKNTAPEGKNPAAVDESAMGVTQLDAALRAMVSRERPRYRTVDQWYLFNLVRLPNGIWVFDRLGRGGTIDGYK